MCFCGCETGAGLCGPGGAAAKTSSTQEAWITTRFQKSPDLTFKPSGLPPSPDEEVTEVTSETLNKTDLILKKVL